MDKILSQKIDSEFTDMKLSKYSGTAKELSGQREQRTRVIVLVPQQLTGKPDEIVLVR